MRNFLLAAAIVASTSLDVPAWFQRELSPVTGAEGAATLLGFGSGNPVTAENYSKGLFTSYQGKALAVLRAGREAGEARLTVSAEGLGREEIVLRAEKE